MQQLAPLPIPPFYCPLPGALHPQWEAVNRRSVEWLEEFGLFESRRQYERLVDTRVGELVGRVSPRGGPEALQVAADFYQWLFAFDDAYCDEGALGSRPEALVVELARILRAAEAPGNAAPDGEGYLAALRDLRLRLDRIATPVQTNRWVEALRGYFFFQVWEAANRSRGTIPTLDEYTVARMQSGAVKATMMLLDVAEGYELPAAEMDHPLTRALTEMACTVIDWDNDIASHHKESLRSRDNQNLRDILAHEQDLSQQEALHRAIAMRDRVMVRFLRLKDAADATESVARRRYVTSLCDWIRGNLDWQVSTNRYRNPEKPVVLESGFAECPSTELTDPLPIPSVQWWWDPGLLLRDHGERPMDGLRAG